MGSPQPMETSQPIATVAAVHGIAGTSARPTQPLKRSTTQRSGGRKAQASLCVTRRGRGSARPVLDASRVLVHNVARPDAPAALPRRRGLA